MLILTRRIGESLIIGDKEIVVTVLGVKGNQIRIGIEAPKHVQINREEVFMRIQSALEIENHKENKEEKDQVQEDSDDE